MGWTGKAQAKGPALVRRAILHGTGLSLQWVSIIYQSKEALGVQPDEMHSA